MNVQRIRTFEELFKFQDDAWDDGSCSDLLFLRDSHRLIDGFLLIVGWDASTYIRVCFIASSDIGSWTEGAKDYLNHYYGVEL